MHLRSYIQNKILLIILAIFFAGNVASGQGQNPVVDEIIAKIDNRIILKSDLTETLKQAANRQNRGQGQSKITDTCRVLKNLVMNKLLLAKADMDTVKVKEETVSNQLDRRMNYFIKRIGSKEKIRELYNKSVEQLKNELRSDIKNQLIVQKVRRQITKDVSITPAEVKEYFNNLPKDSIPYYSAEVEVGQIVRYPKVSKGQENKIRGKLNKIRKKITSGKADFKTMAQKHSQDPGSARAGGELGMRKKGELVPAFEKTALNLKKGEISNVVKTRFGYHLIKLIEKKGDKYNTRHILLKPGDQKLDMEAPKQFLDSIRTLVQKDSLSFEKAAQKYSEHDETKSSGGFFIDQSNQSKRIAMDDLDPNIFFTIDTMEQGEISRPIVYTDESGKKAVRIIYYKKNIPPHEANLEQDYQKIHQEALEHKKQKAVQKWVKNTAKEIYIDIDEKYNHCEIFLNP